MIAFTKSVAREWGPHHIRVNALAPGFVPTENAVAGILSSPGAQERMLDLIPLGRFGTPQEIADVAAFLLGDESRYVTGAVFAADGGRSLGTRCTTAIAVARARAASARHPQLISTAGRES